jgi:hypothetical protein
MENQTDRGYNKIIGPAGNEISLPPGFKGVKGYD